MVYTIAAMLGSIVQSVASWGQKFESKLRHITFVEIDHEIIYAVILPLLLIQEGP